jgi:hypothetical protein
MTDSVPERRPLPVALGIFAGRSPGFDTAAARVVLETHVSAGAITIA